MISIIELKLSEVNGHLTNALTPWSFKDWNVGICLLTVAIATPVLYPIWVPLASFLNDCNMLASTSFFFFVIATVHSRQL